jgi:hypothetical protein
MGNKDIDTEPQTKTNLATSKTAPAPYLGEFEKAITKISARRVLFTRSNEKKEKEPD